MFPFILDMLAPKFLQGPHQVFKDNYLITKTKVASHEKKKKIFQSNKEHKTRKHMHFFFTINTLYINSLQDRICIDINIPRFPWFSDHRLH